jgi:hypothetical protein
LCLILFSGFAVISTAVCLLSAPHLIAWIKTIFRHLKIFKNLFKLKQHIQHNIGLSL